MEDIRARRPFFMRALALALSITAVAYSHPVILIWLSLALVFLVTGEACQSREHFFCIMASTFLAAVLAAALSSPYWLPHLMLKDYVRYTPGLMYRENFTLMDIIGYYGAGLNGFMLPLFALLGFVTSWRSRFIIAVMATSILLFVYITPLSLGWREQYSVLHNLLYPKRTLCVLISLEIILAAHFFRTVEQRWRAAYIPIIGAPVVLMLMFIGFDHYCIRRDMDFTSFREVTSYRFDDMQHMGEFLPLTAHVNRLLLRTHSEIPIVQADDAVAITDLADTADSDITFSADTPVSTFIRINQFLFPGWKIEANGTAAEFCPPETNNSIVSYCYDTNGRIIITAPAGKYRMHVWYGGAPDAAWRNAIAFLVCALSLFGLWKLSRAKRSANSPGV